MDWELLSYLGCKQIFLSCACFYSAIEKQVILQVEDLQVRLQAVQALASISLKGRTWRSSA
jgi:hypothetical protein